MEKKLSVKDLTISFRTSNGRVQAVRGINFDLMQGETLAIVGESGSGKSVTSKAILGILAGNSIIENGEIIYDGKDLLRISEEQFHEIRGDKIAMIFQDPMSSLNPIVKIGKQLTEAMILKGKARQKESRNNFNSYLKNLEKFMIEAVANGDSAKAAQISAKCKDFDKFEYKHIELERAFRKAIDSATEAIDIIEVLSFELSKNANKDAAYRVSKICELAKDSIHEYVIQDRKDELLVAIKQLKSEAKVLKKEDADYSEVVTRLNEIQEILKDGIDLVDPNFFSMGYYVTFSGQPLPDMPIPELNKFLREYLDEHFMLDFISYAKQGLMYTANNSYANKAKALEVLKKALPIFQKEVLDQTECQEIYKELEAVVMSTIDILALKKDDLTYTFATSMKSGIDRYFGAAVKNEKERKEYAKKKAKYDKLVARGKQPEYKLVDPQIVDIEVTRENMCFQMERLIEHYEASLATRDQRNFDDETVAVIDYLKANASGVVNKVTKQIAKARAIKLMEEVGIAEPRKRYNQYPFEFSGGMRQRIVIAIALAADPDILICDEPTTALDVTIQAQILELINKLKEKRHLSVIFITHDLGVVANMADRIAVMYAGKIVELGTAEDVFYDAAHPYTWALLSSMPDLDTNERLEAIPGTPPNMIYPPVGDAFAARNKYAMKIDFEKQPPMFQISDTHFAATWLLHPDAPKVEKPKVIQDRIARMKGKRGE